MLKIFHSWLVTCNINIIQQTDRTKAGKNRIFGSNMLLQDVMILNMLIVCLNYTQGSAVRFNFSPWWQFFPLLFLSCKVICI